jgi:hypothetical protein
MAVKVKEIKDDALMDIKVNKNFYLMSKDTLYTIFKHLLKNESEQENLQNILTKDFNKLSDFERAFYTVTLLVSEIEKQVQGNSELYTERDVPEPGDPDYIEPKQG